MVTPGISNPTDVREFVSDWAEAWNAHDLDRLMSRFSDSVVYSSPFGDQVVPGSDGVFEGSAALREFWAIGFRRVPDLRLEVRQVLAGVRSIVIEYRTHLGVDIAEVLFFGNDGLVIEGHGNYPPGVEDPLGVVG